MTWLFEIPYTVPLWHAPAQQDVLGQNLPLIIGGLLLLLLLSVILFWYISRKQRGKSSLSQDTGPVKVTVPRPPALPKAATLEFTKTNGQPVTYPLTKPALTVGRSADNDIVIDETILQAPTVSKHHARLHRDQDDYLVHDNGSKNGLTVNGRQTLENLLQDGDRVGFGAVEAIFRKPNGGDA